ncbi:MAG: L,D-transpeptidase family protein [Planctomycetes bacterium]|nr:L,D-transpeptidase family protein [Planctomycetota bacterium]
MKRFMFFLFSAALGAGAYWLYVKYYAPPQGGSGGVNYSHPQDGSVGGSKPAVEQPAGPAADQAGSGSEKAKEAEKILGRPEEAAPQNPPSPPDKKDDLSSPAKPAALTAPPAAPPVKVLGGSLEEVEIKPLAGAGSEGKPAAGSFLAGASFEKLQEVVEAAQGALQSGDAVRGLGLYREVFRAARDREDVNAVPVARKLVELSNVEEEKIDYYTYLAGKDPDPAWAYRASLNAATLLAARSAGESVRQSWKLMTQAYLNAKDAEERKKVLVLLDPFLETHLFSKRPSPLLVAHTVKDGESLTAIKNKYGTTVEAILRLNRLKSEVVQPRQRLLILPGKVQVFIQKKDFRLWVLVDGKLLCEKRVGLGQGNSTPVGRFVIRDRIKDPTWYRQGMTPLPPESPENILGSRWLGFQDTEDYSGYGLHGTRSLDSIGKEVSSGCIRLLNEDIEFIYDFITYKTEVVVED